MKSVNILFSLLIGWIMIFFFVITTYGQLQFKAVVNKVVIENFDRDNTTTLSSVVIIEEGSYVQDGDHEITITGDLNQIIEGIYAQVRPKESPPISIPLKHLTLDEFNRILRDNSLSADFYEIRRLRLKQHLTLDEFNRILRDNSLSADFYEIRRPTPGGNPGGVDKPLEAENEISLSRSKARISSSELFPEKEYLIKVRKEEHIIDSIPFDIVRSDRGEHVLKFQEPEILDHVIKISSSELLPDNEYRVDIGKEGYGTDFIPFDIVRSDRGEHILRLQESEILLPPPSPDNITFLVELQGLSSDSEEQDRLRVHIGTELQKKSRYLVWCNFKTLEGFNEFKKRSQQGNNPDQIAPTFDLDHKLRLNYLIRISPEG